MTHQVSVHGLLVMGFSIGLAGALVPGLAQERVRKRRHGHRLGRGDERVQG